MFFAEDLMASCPDTESVSSAEGGLFTLQIMIPAK
jgi:hypothetical protein